MQYSKVIVAVIIAMAVTFSSAVLYTFYNTGAEPVVLIGAFFTFIGTELISLATIKVKKKGSVESTEEVISDGKDRLEEEVKQ